MTNRIFILLLTLGLAFTSCGRGENEDNSENQEETSGMLELAKVNYKVLNNYFVKANVYGKVGPKIETQEEFDEIFGMAAVNGEDGTPTPIDFTKEFVIAVVKSETFFETNLQAMEVQKDNDGKIFFTYKITTGEEHSFSTVPAVLISVDKSEKGKVILNELD